MCLPPLYSIQDTFLKLSKEMDHLIPVFNPSELALLATVKIFLKDEVLG